MMYDFIGQCIAWIAVIVGLATCLSLVLGWVYVCTKVVKYAWGI